MKNKTKKILSKRETPFAFGVESIIFNILSKGISFSKNVLIAVFFGASGITDIYYSAINLIDFPTSLISNAINALIIPKYNQAKRKSFFLRSLFVAIIVIFICTLVIFLIFGKQIASIVYSGFEKEEIYFLGKVLFIISPIILFKPITSYFDNVLRAEKYSIFGNISRIIGAVVGLLIMILMFKYGIYSLSISFLISGVVTCLLLLLVINKFYTTLGDVDLKYAFYQLKDTIPLILGSCLGIINKFVDRYFASFLEGGSITLLNMSSSLNSVQNGLFISTFIAGFYPFISRTLAKKQLDEFEKYIRQVKKMIFGILGLISVISLSISYPILKIIYEHGQFKQENVQLLTELFIIYSVLFITSAIGNIIIQIFYSEGETIIPTVNSIFWLIINLILNYLFVKLYGVKGLALATAIVAVLSTITSLFLLQKKLKRIIINYKEIFIIIFILIVNVFYGYVGWNYSSLFFSLGYYILVTKYIYSINIKKHVKSYFTKVSK
ncbi:MAG: hypothetical protein FH762_05425 [Firmicutes bacterium]|nr:hypothetical protein [Bacillota bacterium]